jgi:hypothetical protein
MAEHTPGPWHAVAAPNDQPSLLYAGIISTLFYSPDHYVSVFSDTPLGEGGDSLLEECQANARLIAAAPLMFEALQKAMEQMEADDHPAACDVPDCWVEAARRALTAAIPGDGQAGMSDG